MLFCFVAVGSKVRCMEDLMRVEVPIGPQTRSIYLQQLKDYPDPSCRATIDPQKTLAVFDLSLTDVYRCGITRITNNLSVSKKYIPQASKTLNFPP